MLMRNTRGGRASRQREDDWRRLQAENSKERRKVSLVTRKLKIGLCAALLAVIMLIATVFPGSLPFSGQQLDVDASSNPASLSSIVSAPVVTSGSGPVSAGISLDHIGELQLRNPSHKLCGGAALYFIESRSKLSDLSKPLQLGTVVAHVQEASEEDCCNACAASDCHAFRYQAPSSCSFLTVDNIAQQLAQQAAQESKWRDESRLRGENSVQTQAPINKHDEPADEVEELAEPLTSSESERLQFGEIDALASDTNGDEDEVTAVDEDEDENTEDQDAEETNDEEETEEEEVVEEDEGGEDESTSEDEGEEDMEEESSGETEEDSDLAALFSGLGGNNEDTSEEDDLFKDLEAFDGGDDFFSLESADSSSKDANLLEQLMSEAENRINPKPKSTEEIEAARIAELRESLRERQLEPDKLEELAKKGLRDILPPGDYNRLTARDPIYGKHKSVFLRYRSQREILAVAKDLADHYKDVELVEIGDNADRKKPLPIMSLRVGNGRRGKHVFVLGTLRGCEWTSSMGILHTAMAIKGRGESTKALLDAVQFHFVMISNPTGFDYSHLHTPSSARSWCKNRRVAVSGSHGVDLEHNWGLDGVSWGFGKRMKEGAKLESFQGPANFSEPETQALRNYMAHYATGRGRVAVIQVKCCSGVITPPQIYRAFEKPIDINLIAGRLAIQMERTDGTKYTVTARETEFHPKNQGQLIDYTYNELQAELSLMVDVKASALSTRQDATKIAIEPFQTLLRELETASIFVAQKLLRVPIRGAAVNVPFTKKPTDPYPTVQGGKRKRKK